MIGRGTPEVQASPLLPIDPKLKQAGGVVVKRLEGLSKLTGSELYVDDLVAENCLWGATVRSPRARGAVREIRFAEGVDWSEFVIVDHRDVPGANEVRLIGLDQPVLAADYVRHVHEPVVLLAHPSREVVRRAVSMVEVVVDADPPVLDFRVAPRPEQIQFGADNVLSELRIAKGDVAVALEAAAHVIEGVYETGAQEHVYLENQGMLAWTEGDVVAVKGSMQCPYYVVKAMTHALGRSEAEVRVMQAATGGGFGGKEEFPSNVAIHAALLTMKAGRPVKLLYERGEDMAATTKRHPSRVRHRTGVDAEGRLVAQEIEVLLDGGAYVTLSPVVLSRAILHASGPYACENVSVVGRAVLSNSVPFGAFRGFGAPQTQFANERHMDVIAQELGMDPLELRVRNLIPEGGATSTGQVITDGTDRVAVMERALELSGFRDKREEHARFNAEPGNDRMRRGIGIATIYHGAGFTGSGEVELKSVVHVDGAPDGSVEVLSGNTEMGQGALTIFTQLACERLGLAPADVTIGPADTARVPDSGPTVASRTSMVVGRLVERACDDLRAQLGGESRNGNGPGASQLRGEALRGAIVRWHGEHPGQRLRGTARYERPPGIEWDPETYRGEAYGAYAWAAYVAEVEVDLATFQTQLLDFVAVQEIGKVLNETLARGQIQGGVVQGIGWALMEECVWEDGAMKNAQLTNYVIPTSDDVPPIRVDFLETPYPHGAQGAKGIGELPMDGPAPAVVNAVAAATGCDARVIPLTPEALMGLMSDG